MYRISVPYIFYCNLGQVEEYISFIYRGLRLYMYRCILAISGLLFAGYCGTVLRDALCSIRRQV